MLTESRCARALAMRSSPWLSLGAQASGNLLAVNEQVLKDVRRAIRDRAERNKNPFYPPISDAGKSDCLFHSASARPARRLRRREAVSSMHGLPGWVTMRCSWTCCTVGGPTVCPCGYEDPRPAGPVPHAVTDAMVRPLYRGPIVPLIEC